MAELDAQLSKHHFKEITTRMTHFSEGTDTGLEWIDYCPAVFRNTLRLQNIDCTEYMRSLCGKENLARVISSGRCGSVFLSSLDDRFVTKILHKSELKVLLEMLPNYYHHLITYKDSLLSKLYGLHVVMPHGGANKVYLAVAANVTKSYQQIHRCYNLKGTTIGRSSLKLVTDNRPVLKE